MNIIDASFEILEYPADPLKMIERAARTSYKSEDKITDDSAATLVKGLIERGHHAMLEFSGAFVVKFISNRGFSHEAVRMRLCSFAQESSRYCNYSKNKFGSEITCIKPFTTMTLEHQSLMVESWYNSQQNYMNLISMGVPAEIARDVLPIGLKTELVMSANAREWLHVFELRTSNKAHPRMRELMRPLLIEFRRRTPILFDDVGTLE